MAHKVCLIIGAGCTFDQGKKLSQKQKPPLDKGFFSVAKRISPKAVEDIDKYIKKNFGLDIFHRGDDSLEAVMAKIYTDLFNENLQAEASKAFQALIQLYNRRIAETTNKIDITKRTNIYSMIGHYLKTGVKHKDITIVTFNQDIQIEKALDKLEQTRKFRKKGRIFNFPYCYNMSFHSCTSSSKKMNNFLKGNKNLGEGIKLLKLHGSLNWYSVHSDGNFAPEKIFNPHRDILITSRKKINIQITYSQKPTFPVVIPPVNFKSGIFHANIKLLWDLAKQALKSANEVVIFGYSCPALDFESSNLIQSSLRSGKYEALWLIDPDTDVLTRYIKLINPDQITYYPSIKDWLRRRN